MKLKISSLVIFLAFISIVFFSVFSWSLFGIYANSNQVKCSQKTIFKANKTISRLFLDKQNNLLFQDETKTIFKLVNNQPETIVSPTKIYDLLPNSGEFKIKQTKLDKTREYFFYLLESKAFTAYSSSQMDNLQESEDKNRFVVIKIDIDGQNPTKIIDVGYTKKFIGNEVTSFFPLGENAFALGGKNSIQKLDKNGFTALLEISRTSQTLPDILDHFGSEFYAIKDNWPQQISMAGSKTKSLEDFKKVPIRFRSKDIFNSYPGEAEQVFVKSYSTQFVLTKATRSVKGSSSNASVAFLRSDLYLSKVNGEQIKNSQSLGRITDSKSSFNLNGEILADTNDNLYIPSKNKEIIQIACQF